jgi:hypothetical protein
VRLWALVVLSLVAAGPGCGGNDATSTTPAMLSLREGPLPAGIYEVETYGPGAVFRIGEGWASHHPDPRFFDLHRLPPGGPVPGTPGWEVALLFLRPEAATTEELVSGIRENGFEVQAQEATTLGGLNGTRIDLAPSRGDANLFAFEGGTVGGFPDRQYRIWALPTDDELLTLVLDMPAEGSEDVALAEAVLASLRFETGS